MKYIYCLRDPTTLEARYIGATNNPKRRLSEHMTSDRRENLSKTLWIESLSKVKPIPEVLEEASDDNWKDREIFWISYAKYIGWPILNINSGGGLNSEEVKLKISKSHIGLLLGRKLTEEHKAKISALGRHHSEDTRRRISESNIKTKLARRKVE